MGNTRIEIFCDFLGVGGRLSYLPLHHVTKGIIFKINITISVKHLLHRESILKYLSILMLAMNAAY